MFSQQLSPSNFPQLGCLPQCHLVLQRIVIACFHPQTDIFCATSVMIAQSILCWSSAAEQKSPFTCLIGSFIRRLSKHVSTPKQMFSVYVKKMGWLNCTLAKILTDLCRATAEWYKVMCWDRSCGHMTCTYMYTSMDFCGGKSFILLRPDRRLLHRLLGRSPGFFMLRLDPEPELLVTSIIRQGGGFRRCRTSHKSCPPLTETTNAVL